MSELWGIQSGFQQFDAQDNSNKLTQMQLAEGNQKMEAVGLQMQEQRFSLESAKMLRDKQEQASNIYKMARMTPGANTGTGPTSGNDALLNTANNLFAMADADYQAGLPQAGNDSAKLAVQAMNSRAKLTHQVAGDTLKQMQLGLNVLSSAASPQDWEAGKTLITGMTGKPLPDALAKMPYSEDNKRLLQQSLMTQYQKQQAELIKVREGQIAMNESLIPARKQMIQAEIDHYKAMDAKLAKTGGPKLPTEKEATSAISDLLQRDYGGKDGQMSTADSRVIARGIAERALQFKQQNPGLSSDKAYHRAYNEAVRNQSHGLGLYTKTERGAEGTYNKPASLPGSANEADPSKVYSVPTPDGKGTMKARWNPGINGFEEVEDPELNDEGGPNPGRDYVEEDDDSDPDNDNEEGTWDGRRR